MENPIREWIIRRPAACRADRRCLLVYDGQCAFCRRLAVMVARLDILGRVLLLDYHTQVDRVLTRAPRLDPDALPRAIHLIMPTGEVCVGFEAVRKLTTVVPPLWPLLPMFYAPGASRAGPVVYDWISRNRHRLFECQPGARCPLHSKPAEPGLASE